MSAPPPSNSSPTSRKSYASCSAGSTSWRAAIQSSARGPVGRERRRRDATHDAGRGPLCRLPGHAAMCPGRLSAPLPAVGPHPKVVQGRTEIAHAIEHTDTATALEA